MNFVPVITHAFAILLGWLLVSFASIPEPGRDRAAGDPASRLSRSFRSGGSDQRPSHPSLLAAQAENSMDPASRAALKRRILTDWATTDPGGLLRYLDQRPWLSGDRNAADKALEIMARTRPADLLAYAKREGCPMAITSLCHHGDPRLVLDLLLSLPAGAVFDEHLALVFERGCGLDPEFHHRIDGIENSETRLAVFEAVAGALIEDKRDDALFPWLARHAESLPAERVVRLFALDLVLTRSDVNRLAGLPDSMRPLALRQTLRNLPGIPSHDNESYQRASLTTFLKNGWLDKNMDLANAVISVNAGAVPDVAFRSTAATGWKDWALDLPKSSKWDSLRRTAVRRWALENPDQWNAIVGLPTRDLRDAAYAAILHTIDFERDGGRVPWIINQINDAALRNLAAEVITARVDGESGDPPVDPFRPLGFR